MNVEATSGAQQAQKAGAARQANAPQTVDYQSFLRLLVAEMKNQDPTSPMESTDYVAQLASFSQVEQSVQANAKLDQILQASALAQAGSLVGREVTSADGEITGTVAEVRLYSDGVMAVLESGDKIPVGPGVVIR
ncbi:flagellar hook assembly protein FlgD [Nitratireductor aquimarinus]|uniref:Basal-body rod modification protein FlgD n=1 Tax=Nitratireductor aquimarinus TaxID=889300 RepID=A0ABU4AGM7_9HYPH|nr:MULTISPECIES: flagellar hook assembly protein FlgD [Alphaproteobacteria]MBY6021661.1 flagellar hook assembly protein FlgD [Nitratireductor sp. DP7N14-4]MBN7756748.1 flagellar hook assembly protein FlgD [Nitratireductor aquimarinus]MBN7761929.1 flagellar hook assembly protein FlgD [Nitratireductor aquibiodomus]MBN7775193.1 flagellar hook assembly protein FlgD [Nitratireductor pacificus]MBN7781207.1 flagellar hook assembly protein FlgD [Nitratireductor pacificus]